MTKEEKAKVYDEAIERAKTLYNSVFVNNDILEQNFPELAESEDSEDERIRKELLAVINDLVLPEEQRARFNTWLEKQKYDRMKPIYDAKESFESALEKAWNDYHNGYENVDKLEDDYVECAHAKGFREGYLFGIEKQKEPVNVSVSTMIPSCWEEEQKDNKFAPRVLPCSTAWFEDGEEKQKEQDKCPEYCVRSHCIGCSIYEKQKEQKPAEWTELTWKDVNDLEEIMNEVRSDYRGGGIGQKSFGLEVLERFRYMKGDELDVKEQKPTEWGEEKEKVVDNYADEIIKWEDAHKDWDRQVIRATAYHFFNFQPKQEWSEDEKIRELIDMINECTNWLHKKNSETEGKAIFKMEEKEQKPTDWGEYDERMRKSIIRVLESFVSQADCESYPALSASYPTYFKEIDWLKSLRPQPKNEWSEKNMPKWKKVTDYTKLPTDAIVRYESDKNLQTENAISEQDVSRILGFRKPIAYYLTPDDLNKLPKED